MKEGIIKLIAIKKSNEHNNPTSFQEPILFNKIPFTSSIHKLTNTQNPFIYQSGQNWHLAHYLLTMALKASSLSHYFQFKSFV